MYEECMYSIARHAFWHYKAIVLPYSSFCETPVEEYEDACDNLIYWHGALCEMLKGIAH